jgi:hypothetical protein
VILLCYLLYHAHRGKESFDTHVWILKTLLERTPNSVEDMDTFHHYIIAVSIQKMNSRMTNDIISTLYYDCLQDLPTFPYIRPKELESGCPNRDGSFIRAIPSLKKYADTKIPFLQQFAETRTPNEETKTTTPQHQLSEIYDENTCIEFHLLLCELLYRFKGSLDIVMRKRAEKNPKSQGVLNSLGSVKQERGEEGEVLKALKRVRIVGHFLKTMVTSSIMEAHLLSIANFLVFDPRKSWTPGPEDSEDTDLAEFEYLKPFSMRRGRVVLLWESYRDWLTLLVHYFVAAEELALYVKNFGSDVEAISISILSPPQSSKSGLPWTKLLENERFFPTVLGQPSGKEFVDFLGKMPKTNDGEIQNLKEVTKSTLLLKGELESISPAQLDNKIDELTKQLNKLTSLEFDHICEEFLALKKFENPRARIQKIEDMLSVLSRQAVFYQQLREGSIHSGENFRGVYHCEAFTASLLTLWDKTSGKVVDDFNERLNTVTTTSSGKPSPRDISEIKKVTIKMKASYVFMHSLESLFILTTGLPASHRSV